MEEFQHKNLTRSLDILSEDVHSWMIELDVLLALKQYPDFDSQLQKLIDYLELHKIYKKGLPPKMDIFDLGLRKFHD